MVNVCCRLCDYSLAVDRFSFTQRDRARASSGLSFIGYYCLNELMSPFSSAIIDDIRVISEAKLVSMAYFYFDFRDIHKQSRRDMISSVLFQLSTQSIRYHEILYRLYLAHHSGAQRPSDGVLTECLKDMLSVPSEVPMYIIMDAIDECSDASRDTPGMSPREEILELVEELIDLRLPNLRLCVTSRPEIDIRVALEPLSSFQISLHDETGQRQDIANYIRDFIASDQIMRRWRGEEEKELVIDVLTLQNHGVSGSHCAPIPVAHVCYLGFYGCPANWKRYVTAPQQVCAVSWTTYPRLWTRHTSTY